MAQLILLGAGASFGSEDAEPRPPLGNSLFDCLEKRNGIASTFPEELKIEFRKNFEIGMAKYDEWSSRNIMQFQRELSSFLAEFSPSPNNTYIKMLSTLGVKRFVYCSLNYDLMLELAALRLGMATTYSQEKGHGMRLLKVHGSSNFWPALPPRYFSNSTFKNNGIDLEVGIKPVSQEDALYKSLTENSIAPAMCVYAEGKRANVSSTYIKKQQEMWFHQLEKSPRIFVSGVRVNANDDHIWGAIGRRKLDVYYYGLENDHDEFIDWKAQHEKKNAFFKLADFSQAIDFINARI
ncbi:MULTISPECIES: hypothetical protein [Halomonadaceae]|uniref:hypothetical protein n=1 Tax=Halomonadaceae TaxID=28256 RepID=UPI0015996975|nr:MULTISPECIES: hypothetical protein [Halomonas]QJQ93952.1 hypothetical protein HIO72_00665 [Halomonas sp. PA5]